MVARIRLDQLDRRDSTLMPIDIDESIRERVEAANEQVLGVARSQALAGTYQSLAHALGLMMLSDQHNRQSMQTVEIATVAATCRRILAVGPGQVKRG